MDCNAISFGITSLILMAMSKKKWKVSNDWCKMPERQNLFPGLDSAFFMIYGCDIGEI